MHVSNDLGGLFHDPVDQVLNLGQVVHPLRAFAARHHRVFPVAHADGLDAGPLIGDQFRRNGAPVIGNACKHPGRLHDGILQMDHAGRGLQPPGRSHDAAGHQGPPILRFDDLFLPQGVEVALFRRQKPCPHLHTGGPHGYGRRQGLAVAESAGPHHGVIGIRYRIDHGGQQNHGVERLPGDVKTAFVPGSDDAVHPRLLASQRALHRGDDVQPGKSGGFDLLAPGDGVAGRGKEHLEMLLHSGVLLTDPDRRIDQDLATCRALPPTPSR